MRQHLAGGRYEFNTKNQRIMGIDVYIQAFEDIKTRLNKFSRVCLFVECIYTQRLL